MLYMFSGPTIYENIYCTVVDNLFISLEGTPLLTNLQPFIMFLITLQSPTIFLTKVFYTLFVLHWVLYSLLYVWDPQLLRRQPLNNLDDSPAYEKYLHYRGDLWARYVVVTTRSPYSFMSSIAEATIGLSSYATSNLTHIRLNLVGMVVRSYSLIVVAKNFLYPNRSTEVHILTILLLVNHLLWGYSVLETFNFLSNYLLYPTLSVTLLLLFVRSKTSVLLTTFYYNLCYYIVGITAGGAQYDPSQYLTVYYITYPFTPGPLSSIPAKHYTRPHLVLPQPYVELNARTGRVSLFSLVEDYNTLVLSNLYTRNVDLTYHDVIFNSKVVSVPTETTFEADLNRVLWSIYGWGIWVKPNYTYLKYTKTIITVKMSTILLVGYFTWAFYIVTQSLLNLLTRLWSYKSELIAFILVTVAFDALGSDEEPLWEPVEWSMVQTWLLFIFIFGWFAEGLILSRYGGYTGRDKRVWFSLYKTYWLLEIYYILSLGAAIVCVITPFYYELNYEIAHIFSWWHWYSRVFFSYTMFIFALLTVLMTLLQISIRWAFWKKTLLIVFFINILLTYLLYTQFILACFSYFTDPVWFHRNRTVDYIQLSHEPAKWGWGTGKRDHFTYHNTKTSFWFKSDGPYASAMIFIQFALFISLFLVYVFWLVLFRRIYATKEVPLTFTVYCVSALKQFLFLFYLMYFLVGFSFFVTYLRSPFSDYNLSELVSDNSVLIEYPLYVLEYAHYQLNRWVDGILN